MELVSDRKPRTRRWISLGSSLSESLDVAALRRKDRIVGLAVT